MDDYETLLVQYLKEGKISMDNYVQLNNTNLLNVKDNLEIVNKFDNSVKDGFNKRYSEMIKLKDNQIVFKNKIIFNRLIKKSNLTYTDDQKNSINNMIRFISNPNDKLFGLFGYAGTGKTTTIIDFLMNCLELKYISSLLFTAPTNKALNVIKDDVIIIIE
jgi:flagellar biosynthesis GTPase FlhF